MGITISSLKERGVCLNRVDRGREKKESLPPLGLGIINIAPLHGRTNLTTRVWVRSLGMGMGRCQAPNPTQPIGWLPVFVSYVLVSLKIDSILSSIPTHTLAYIQQLTWHQSSQNSIHLLWQLISNLAYIYHAYHIISSKATNKQDIIRVETQTWQQGIKIKYNLNI